MDTMKLKAGSYQYTAVDDLKVTPNGSGQLVGFDLPFEIAPTASHMLPSKD
jgi:hypothetical protein